MAVNTQLAPDPKREFVENCLEAFELDAKNRDVALAECLFHLQQMSTLVSETVQRMSSGPMAGMLGKLSGR